MPNSKKTNSRILEYTIPRLHEKGWYIDFLAFDPLSDGLKRKKIFVKRIERVSDRRIYARDIIVELTEKLRNGWSPWIDVVDPKQLIYFDAVCEAYTEYATKLYHTDYIREETWSGYLSYLRMIQKYNNEARRKRIVYIYQFNREFITELLNYIFLELNRKPQTRDNYLAFVRVFGSWLVQNNYCKTNPSEGITVLGKRHRKKERTIIAESDVKRLSEHLQQQNKHYLLACYILFYCFIRPKEMAKLQLNHISLANKMIHVPAAFSKNRKDGFVSLPKKVIELMLDLEIFNNPNDYYIFSDRCQPGKNWRDEKQFRDMWAKVKKALGFPDSYKFYSLKDTGITSMLRLNYDPLTVRDQARHSSILMTDIYTPHDIQQANELIVKHEGSL